MYLFSGLPFISYDYTKYIDTWLDMHQDFCPSHGESVKKAQKKNCIAFWFR